MYVGFDLLKQMWCLKHARKNHHIHIQHMNKNTFYIGKKQDLKRKIEKLQQYNTTNTNTAQMQYFHGAASESKLQVKV